MQNPPSHMQLIPTGRLQMYVINAVCQVISKPQSLGVCMKAYSHIPAIHFGSAGGGSAHQSGYSPEPCGWCSLAKTKNSFISQSCAHHWIVCVYINLFSPLVPHFSAAACCLFLAVCAGLQWVTPRTFHKCGKSLVTLTAQSAFSSWGILALLCSPDSTWKVLPVHWAMINNFIVSNSFLKWWICTSLCHFGRRGITPPKNKTALPYHTNNKGDTALFQLNIDVIQVGKVCNEGRFAHLLQELCTMYAMCTWTHPYSVIKRHLWDDLLSYLGHFVTWTMWNWPAQQPGYSTNNLPCLGPMDYSCILHTGYWLAWWCDHHMYSKCTCKMIQKVYRFCIGLQDGSLAGRQMQLSLCHSHQGPYTPRSGRWK